MTIIVDGYAVHYEKVGKGPVILALHGWGDSLSTFAQLTKKLQESYTVIALDLPGFGATDAPREPFTLEIYARFVAQFVAKIEAGDLYAIIGHSNGGAIAIKGTSLGILQPKALLLLASAGIRSTYKGRKKAIRLMAKAVKLPTKLLPGHMQKSLKKKAYAKLGSDLFVAEGLQETFKLIVGEDVLLESAMITVPTLLLYGSEDTATPPEYGELYKKQIEKSRLKIIQNADHFLHHTHHAETLQEIEQFLEQV